MVSPSFSKFRNIYDSSLCGASPDKEFVPVPETVLETSELETLNKADKSQNRTLLFARTAFV